MSALSGHETCCSRASSPANSPSKTSTSNSRLAWRKQLMKLEPLNAGEWRQRAQYKSFEPVPVNHEWIWEDATINTLLESANRALGELNDFSLIVPDIDLFIEMHVVKEAPTSSRIEGTQTGIDEALMSEEQIQPEKRDDWREVRNYIEAVNTAINELKSLPLSNRLLKQ